MTKTFSNPLASTAAPAPAAKPAAQGPAAGQVQLDGTKTTQFSKPTNRPLQPRSASPANYNTSGLEAAMGAHANKMHPPKRR